jgi:pSer/pThr/pTyr-binding forkhead associated (FHA) protein
MLGKLAPCGGGPPILLLKPRLLVGRQRDCDVPLSFPSVSSRHCELELLDGFWHVRDLGSTNGTRVNGSPCTAEWLLPDDVLALSKHRYAVLYTPPAGRPPPRQAGPMAEVGARLSPPPSAPAPPPRATRPVPPGPAGGAALGRLVPCGGGPPLPLLQPRVVIGRDAACDIVLRSPAVSGRHCLLEWADGGWSVRDLGSKNGTRVDGVRCTEQRLAPGSTLWVGVLRFQLVYNAPGAVARPEPPPAAFGQSLLEKAGLARWRPPDVTDPKDKPPERYNLDEPD